MDLYADRSTEHGVTGLTPGFEAYTDVLTARHSGFNLLGSKPFLVNDAKAIFYAFYSDTERGKGIFLFTGDTRLVVECVCLFEDWGEFAAPFTAMLESFRLDEPQRVLDFPKPDAAIKRKALADPKGLAEEAKADMLFGEDLLKRRSVRPENLYRAVKQLQVCLQKASALSARPPFYQEAAKRLAYATSMFDDAVNDQEFRITMATKQRDWDAVQVEAARLMQMVPDRTDPIYQYALDLTHRYRKEEEER
jgi:hypothetical protein